MPKGQPPIEEIVNDFIATDSGAPGAPQRPAVPAGGAVPVRRNGFPLRILIGVAALLLAGGGVTLGLAVTGGPPGAPPTSTASATPSPARSATPSSRSRRTPELTSSPGSATPAPTATATPTPIPTPTDTPTPTPTASPT